MMMKLSVQYVPARSLSPNPFNPNRIDPATLDRLRNSLDRLGTFKPILVRELDDTSLQILGGYHRAILAQERDEDVPVINLGLVDDQKAKELTLADNAVYGRNDSDLMNDLLKSMDVELAELSTFLPGHYEDLEFDLSAPEASVDLETLGMTEPEEPVTRPAPTHTTLRFRVPIDDAHRITDKIQEVIEAEDFTGGSSSENAGDALVYLFGRLQ